VIDVLASYPWYVDHVRPVWLALPPEMRGRFYVSQRSVHAAEGLPGVTMGRPGGEVRPIYTVSFGDFRSARMLGRQSIALGQHGAGQSYSNDHPAYPGGRSQGEVSLFLVPNETAARRTRAAYPRARVEVVGCPKLDTLPTKERNGDPVIAFSFHWDSKTIAPEMSSAWEYYQRAIALLSRHRHVIGHAHPREMFKIGKWYQRTHIPVVQSFDEVLRRADVYACDNSSSLFEFATTGRPVVVLNQPAYRRNVEHGLRFWEAAGVGVNVDDPLRLGAAVDRAIEDAPEVAEAREAALRIVYQPLRGGAELAAAALMDWATAQAPEARRRERRLR
jgi:hypothetical protein